MATDPLSLAGAILSAGGILQSIWQGRQTKIDLQLLEKILRELSAEQMSQTMVLDEVARLLRGGGLELRSGGQIPTQMIPPKEWAEQLHSASLSSNSPKGLIIAPTAGRVDLWRVDQSHIKKILSKPGAPISASFAQPAPDVLSLQDPRFQAALDLLREGQVSLALNLFRLVNVDSSRDLAWRCSNNIAVCHLKLGNPAAALEAIELRPPEKADDLCLFSFNRAVTLYDLDRFEEAREWFLKAMASPSLADAALSAALDCAARF